MKKPATQIFVSNKQKDVKISASSTCKLVSNFLRYWKVHTDQVYVYFFSDEELARLHNEIFGDPSLTDTITLPIDPVGAAISPHVLGEAFVSPKAALRFLEENHLNQDLLYEEISRYLVHSLLHMLGYDDQTEEEKEKMHRKENLTLCMLKKNHALLTY